MKQPEVARSVCKNMGVPSISISLPPFLPPEGSVSSSSGSGQRHSLTAKMIYVYFELKIMPLVTQSDKVSNQTLIYVINMQTFYGNH